MHSFTRAGGYYPAAGVIEADDGALYGVTTEGGAGRSGVAFRLARDSGYTVLHNFGVVAGDGTHPWGSLLFASDGYFYGAANFGGERNEGVVYRMDKAGTITPLWQLGAPGDPALALAALIEGADGLLYGTTRAGGEFRSGTIYRLAKDGSQQQVLCSFQGLNGASPQVPLLEAGDGSFYGVTTFGGARGAGTAFRFSPDGTLTVLHSFRGGSDGQEPNTAARRAGGPGGGHHPQGRCERARHGLEAEEPALIEVRATGWSARRRSRRDLSATAPSCRSR